MNWNEHDPENFLTEKDRAHRTSLLHDFAKAFSLKYALGKREHGGFLWDHDPLWFQDQLENEIQDAWAYCRSMRPAIETLLSFIESKGFSMDDVREYASERPVLPADKSLAANL